MKNESNIDFFIIIAARKRKEELLTFVLESGGRIVNLLYGKGSVKSKALMEAFGLALEENKIIITFLTTRERSNDMFKTLVSDFKFDQPNTGVAFTIPVDGLSY